MSKMGSDGGHGALSSAQLRANQLKIAAVVASYFVISISLVFANKVLLDKRFSIEAPLFMTWFQCLVTVGICWLNGELGRRAAPDSFFKQFPTFSYNLATARKLLPLSIVFVGMMSGRRRRGAGGGLRGARRATSARARSPRSPPCICPVSCPLSPTLSNLSSRRLLHITFNNLCLQYVEVSFYNVARSLTIVFNVIFTYMMLGEATSRTTLICLGMVIVGFFVGSGGEVNFSLIGTLFGVSSSVFVSLNSIYTKKVMPVVDGNQWTLAAYNNMNAVLMFVPIILVVERDVLLANLHVMTQGYYWLLMWVGGAFGFLIGIVTIMQIKLTSPLTHNISGTAKAGVQTVLALAIWQNPTTPANLAGIALVLAGSFLYAYIRNREMETTNARRLAAKATTAAEGGAGEPAKAAGDGAAAPAAADGSASSSSAGADEKETAGLLERGGAGGADSKA